VVAAALFVATGFDVAKLWGAPQGAGMLPLAGDLGMRAAYPLLSGAHAFDVLNEILLVAPAALLSLALGLRADGRAVAVFLATAAAGSILFLCVANPEVGFFRDWDAFSFAAVPLLAWTAVSVAGRVTDQATLAHAAILLVGASALHTAAWLSVNADAARAEARFVRLLSSCTLSEHARAYGWESIGSRYKLTRRFDEALDAFERAIEASPDNPRHRNTAGELHLLAGRDDEARRHFERAVALNPELAEAWHGLGVARFRAGDDVAAIRAFEETIARRPDAAPAWYNLGLCRQRLGMPDEAAAAFRRVLALEGSGPLAEDVRRRLAELEATATRR
jgi:tetratricopeptide (TPR) repeat protein